MHRLGDRGHYRRESRRAPEEHGRAPERARPSRRSCIRLKAAARCLPLRWAATASAPSILWRPVSLRVRNTTSGARRRAATSHRPRSRPAARRRGHPPSSNPCAICRERLRVSWITVWTAPRTPARSPSSASTTETSSTALGCARRSIALRMFDEECVAGPGQGAADHDPRRVDDVRDVGEHAADGVAGVVDDAADAGVVGCEQRQQIVDVEVGSVRRAQRIEQRPGGCDRAETALGCRSGTARRSARPGCDRSLRRVPTRRVGVARRGPCRRRCRRRR